MKKLQIGETRNAKAVYVDLEGSHAATHIADTRGLLALVQEFIADLQADRDNIYLDKDMGRLVGVSDLVETSENDEIIYAKRLNRDNYTRFVLGRKAEPTNRVAVVLQRDAAGDYELRSAWIGSAVPQFPGDEPEAPDSKSFWQEHALVWGNQAIQPGTERNDWPWN